MTLVDFQLPRFMRRMLAPFARVVLTDEVEELGLTNAVIEGFELTLRSFPTYLRAGLVLISFLFEFGAIFFHLRPFTRLERAQQEHYFRRWWESKPELLHQGIRGFKGLVALAYWDLPLVRERMAFRPEEWIAEVSARRLRNHGASIAEHERIVVESNPLVPLSSLAGKTKREHGRAS